MRRALDPLGDTIRRGLFGTQHDINALTAGPSAALAIESLSNVHLMPDYIRTITDLSNSLTQSRSQTADLVANARLLAGPLDEARRAFALAGETRRQLAGAFAALKAFEDRFRIHGELWRVRAPRRRYAEVNVGYRGHASAFRNSGSLRAAISGMTNRPGCKSMRSPSPPRVSPRSRRSARASGCTRRSMTA